MSAGTRYTPAIVDRFWDSCRRGGESLLMARGTDDVDGVWLVGNWLCSGMWSGGGDGCSGVDVGSWWW